MVSVDELQACRDLTVGILQSVQDRDWATQVPHLEFDVTRLAAHMSQTNFWYAVDFTARGADLAAYEPVVKVDAAPADLIASIDVGVDLLATVIAAAPADARGFHPFGLADRSGFAAMACDEMLIHTDDIARTFEIDFDPPTELVAAVLGRLFPDVNLEADPWAALRWANGRIEAAGRPQRQKWRWHCAPLDEWQPASG